MSALPDKIKYLVELMGLKDASVDFDLESRRISIIADEDEWFKNQIPSLVKDFKHLIALMAHKEEDHANYFVDINNYRKEREKLIVKLAVAAAQKATWQNQMTGRGPHQRTRVEYTAKRRSHHLVVSSAGLGDSVGSKIVNHHITRAVDRHTTAQHIGQTPGAQGQQEAVGYYAVIPDLPDEQLDIRSL